MSDSIQVEYDRLKAVSAGPVVSDHFRQFSNLFADQQLWKSYIWLLDIADKPLKGATVVDIGCKYGHLMPLLIAKGAQSTIGVDVDDLYLQPAKDVIAANWPQASFVKSEWGFLPIKSDSADLIIVNEVISHVNPGYLPTMFSEIGRILRVGGRVIISDGNNIANDACRQDLVNVYDAWENGPEGRNTGRDVVEGSFLELRKQRIRGWFPDLGADKVDYLALNTSGLFGDYLKTVIERYLSGGEFIERRYRRGDCPTNPGDGGRYGVWLLSATGRDAARNVWHARPSGRVRAAYRLERRQACPRQRVRSSKLLVTQNSPAQRVSERKLGIPDSGRQRALGLDTRLLRNSRRAANAEKSGGHRLWGSELRAWRFARGLAGLDFDVSIAAADGGLVPTDELGPVRAPSSAAKRGWLSRLVTPLRHRHSGDGALWSAANADIYVAFGAAEYNADLADWCKANERPLLLFAGSDADFSVDYRPGNSARNVWGSRCDRCFDSVVGATAIVVQTEFQRRSALERYGRDADVVVNPIPVAELADRADAGAFLWIGKAVPNKRPDLVLEIARACPEHMFVMILNDVGNGLFEKFLATRGPMSRSFAVSRRTISAPISPGQELCSAPPISRAFPIHSWMRAALASRSCR